MPLFFHNLSSLIENIESLEMHGNAHYHNETCQMHFGNLGPLLDDVGTAFLSGKRVYS